MSQHNTFSIIIPVYSEWTPQQEGAAGHIHMRAAMIQRAIKSIINQQYPHWELILVDDGCVDGLTPEIMQKFADTDSRIKIVRQENQNRAVARNRGMEEATNDWICWMDSDDEYSTHYLREMNQAINDFPEYKIFNFGSLIYYPDHRTDFRPVYTPPTKRLALKNNWEDGADEEGHVWFSSGYIGCGSFIFRRDLWAENQEKYRIPDEVNAYQFAAASGFDMRLTREKDAFRYDNTEDPDNAFRDKVYRHGTSLGNPWGDDFLQFYLLTRDNESKPLDVYLYIQYPRAHEEIYEYFGEVYPVEGPANE